MFINQLSSKGGSHLIFRAVNWWNESWNSHDSLPGLFLSTQPPGPHGDSRPYPPFLPPPHPATGKQWEEREWWPDFHGPPSGRERKSVASAQPGCEEKAIGSNGQPYCPYIWRGEGTLQKTVSPPEGSCGVGSSILRPWHHPRPF